MKKVISILAIVTLVACNNVAEAPAPAVDSVKAADSTLPVDSSPAQIDSSSVK